jgi:RimJ/RimL family protein N-acetyltransferase
MSILGKNIKLRAIEKKDLKTIQQWRNNPKFQKFFREYRELSETHINKWYEEIILNDKFEFFIIEKMNSIKPNKIIGITGITYIDWKNRHADLHFYIGDKDAWVETKYSDEAFKLILNYGFNTLNLNKLWAEIYQIDTGKLSFFNGNKFQIDAKLREHYYYEGEYYSSFILSLLKRDYEKSINNSSTS